MFFDLNVPISKIPIGKAPKKKGQQEEVSYSTHEITAIETRIDLLIHLGYTVIAFAQTVKQRVDTKTHVNTLNVLVDRLRTRPGIVYLKRLNIILDQESEKGFGLISANVSLFNSYDLIALIPTTQPCFAVACLTYSLPSNLTAHIISLPLTLPRLPFHLKHTMVRTAIKNGAVFEINYVGALGGEHDPLIVDANVAENGPYAKRNWWASARELVRVTKCRGLLISGGVFAEADHRAPRDVGNLITMLGLSQDVAHDGLTTIPKSLIVRAQTRMTYRAVLSEPQVVLTASVASSEPTATPSGPSQDHQNQQDDEPPAKRQRAVEGVKSDADFEIGSQKKKKRKKK